MQDHKLFIISTAIISIGMIFALGLNTITGNAVSSNSGISTYDIISILGPVIFLAIVIVAGLFAFSELKKR